MLNLALLSSKCLDLRDPVWFHPCEDYGSSADLITYNSLMRACAKALLRWMGVVPCTLNTWKKCVDVLSVSWVLFLIRNHISGLVLPLHVYVCNRIQICHT